MIGNENYCIIGGYFIFYDILDSTDSLFRLYDDMIIYMVLVVQTSDVW